jgi:hypothetical protein
VVAWVAVGDRVMMALGTSTVYGVELAEKVTVPWST